MISGFWVCAQEPFFMSAHDLEEWDERHRGAAEKPPAQPASFVVELLPLLPHGPALDLACGTGRHTLVLAARGQPVTAIDGSAVALDVLEKRADGLHQPVRRTERFENTRDSRPGILLIHADLEQVGLPRQSFALILCIHYLQRSLFGEMERALAPGGMLLFETFTRAQLEFAGGPKNPEYLLEPGELRTAFPSLRLLFYRELRAGNGIASLLAQKAVGHWS
jgi:tellurite methyltransferase